MGCGCGNNINPNTLNAQKEVQTTVQVQAAGLPEWEGNKLVNHKAKVTVKTGFHLVKVSAR